MKKNQLILSLILSALLSSCDRSNKDSQEGVHTKTYKKQTENFSYNFTRKMIGTLRVQSQQESIIKGFRLKWYNEHLWMGNNLKLIRYDASLNNYEAFGKQGGGPDENQNITYFTVSNDSYTIFDFEKQRVATYTFKDSLLRYQKFNDGNIPFIDYFGIQESKNEYLLMYEESSQSKGYDYKFSITNNTGARLKDFSLKKLLNINDLEDLELALEGEFITNHPKFTVFYFFKVGKFIVYEGTLRNTKIYDTVDKTPIPQTVRVTRGDGGFNIQTKPPYIIFSSASVSKNHLYLLSTLAEKNYKMLDIYQLTTGKYIGSIKLPDLDDGQSAELIQITPDEKRLYVQYEDLGLVNYTIDYFMK
ncbi:MAG: hypothetical protein HC912_03860 [Saprospiraceae bacterium]|nr:hypothetical protein [Saprospiraceae bacterium]